jgi:hypothetical protein
MNSLFEAIAEKNRKSINKLCTSKIDVSKLIDHMTQFYMTKNLWILEEINNHVHDPRYIASLMIHIDKKPLQVKSIKGDFETLKTTLYFNISSRSNVKECLIIIAYLSKKHYEFCETIINYLLEYGSFKSPEIKEYITMCKALYDQKPSKKRINLIYYAVYVYITEHVNYVIYEQHNTYDYLFVYLERDVDFEEQVEKDRGTLKSQHIRTVTA